MSELVSCTVPTADDRAASDGKAVVTFRLQLVVVNASGHERVQEVARIERDEVAMETLGLTLAEGKLILKRIQEGVVQEQIQGALLRRRNCPEWGKARHRKGHHDVAMRTRFGNIELQSPRLEHCRCQPHVEKTFSPLQAILPEHTSPEMLYLEVNGVRCCPIRLVAICCMTCCQ